MSFRSSKLTTWSPPSNMDSRPAILIFFAMAVSLSTPGLAGAETPAPFAPAVIEVGPTVVQPYAPALGTNSFGDIGGTYYATNNLIPDLVS